MNTIKVIHPAYLPLIRNANANLILLGLPPLDLGATAPVAPSVMDDGRCDPSADCRRCGGRGHIVTVDGAISCPECNADTASDSYE